MASKENQPSANSQTGKKGSYIGSVRFFKNLILLVVLLLIATPTVISIACAQAASVNGEELSSYRTKYEEAEKTIAQLQDEISGDDSSEDSSNSSPDSDPTSYQELYPDFYVTDPKPEVVTKEGYMYLTLDDGPSEYTPEILSILKQKDVKATFFVVTQGGEFDISQMKQIVAEGHELAMHSTTHDLNKIYNSVEDFLEDYYQLFKLIRDEVGVTPTIFRFPGGSLNAYNQRLYQEIISEMLRRGFVYYDWSLSTGDAVNPPLSKDKILENVLDNSANKRWGIILMHDSENRHSTVEALPEMIDGLRAQGFTLDKLDRSVRPITFGYPRCC
ncbi:MAG: polysaccharide deacetylase [Clostridiales bacterium]|nr:polysaccharide deacetylase [Clostridiales bacterium]